MASSRWKRFAFFDRHNLTLPPQVLDDLVPDESIASPKGRRMPSKYSLFDEDEDENLNATDTNLNFGDHFSMAVTTAALPVSNPLESKVPPTNTRPGVPGPGSTQNPMVDGVSDMLSSLTACTVPSLQTAPSKEESGVITLRSGVLLSTDVSTPRADNGSDGLVLLFLSSRQSNLVHCVDLTMRCNPVHFRDRHEIAHANPVQATDSGEVREDVSQGMNDGSLEEMDGWRGYFSPFTQASVSFTKSGNSKTRNRAEERILSEHLGTYGDARAQSGSNQVLDLATCKVKTPDGTHSPILLACISDKDVVVYEDPHLHLTCRLPPTPGVGITAAVRKPSTPFPSGQYGSPRVLDISPELVAVGSDKGTVLLYSLDISKLSLVMVLPPPPFALESFVTSTFFSEDKNQGLNHLFISYSRHGVCCYDLTTPLGTAPSSRYDLDGRPVSSSCLCDVVKSHAGSSVFMVARMDGIYSYSHSQKVGIAPIDGPKIAICALPQPATSRRLYPLEIPIASSIGTSYVLVASTDAKSGRDAVDLYDATNKLVAFHFLLSPGHKALKVAGVTTCATHLSNGGVRGGRSSAIILTSGGAIVTLTEKITLEKVSLLVQKNLFAAAISMAYADPAFQPCDITTLYRKYAEYLYRKGDFNSSMDQYISTIGSLESSHVIFRFLDAPKISLLTRYLEELNTRGLATSVHLDLLRTCYLKMNDSASVEKITSFPMIGAEAKSTSPVDKISNLLQNPTDALATLCSFEASEAKEALQVHGATLARAFPKETAGIVIALCNGTYSPSSLLDLTAPTPRVVGTQRPSNQELPEQELYEKYTVESFTFAFLENPRVLRLVLAHCNRSRCALNPSLSRTLLELTLEEMKTAAQSGELEIANIRKREAVSMLTDGNSTALGHYESLVTVQLAGFSEGELLLFEKLQMSPMLMERYGDDGGDRARRQMLAICRTDPELLADVLSHFVRIASDKLSEEECGDEVSELSDGVDILCDIQEVLSLANSHSVMPPVRVTRILAGEGAGQFSSRCAVGAESIKYAIPLYVVLEYVGMVLKESSIEIKRLNDEVDEFNQLCGAIEREIEDLVLGPGRHPKCSVLSKPDINIEEMYTRVRASLEDEEVAENQSEQSKEEFWREMECSDDRYSTVARFFSKGMIN
mmetsp:Transcript_23120/g.35442  ORF Transcript_23120/g.35442 Transcript_23120/m.35442 type:complete len:1153 (+) Transcript_23120:35-3493(+)